jgi:hypothetical protein
MVVGCGLGKGLVLRSEVWAGDRPTDFSFLQTKYLYF